MEKQPFLQSLLCLELEAPPNLYMRTRFPRPHPGNSARARGIIEHVLYYQVL